MIRTKKSVDQFIKECILKYGDIDLYDKVVYVNIDTLVEFVCKKHGSFWQTPYRYLSGCRCKECKTEERYSKSLVDFLIRIKQTNKYYREGFITYLSGYTSKCNPCLFKSRYGTHKISPYLLLSDVDLVAVTALDRNEFYRNLLKDKNKYYDEGYFDIEGDIKTYKSTVKIRIESETEYRKYESLLVGSMPYFKREKVQKPPTHIENFLNNCKERRKDFENIDYSVTSIGRFNTKSDFKCKKHDIVYSQKRSHHLDGHQGCPICKGNVSGVYCESNISEKDKKIPSIFYIIKLSSEDEVFYKVGITKNTLDQRFKEMRKMYKVEILDTVSDNLYSNFKEEQTWLSYFKEYQYKPKQKFGGWTECFSKDVLSIYNHIIGCSHEEHIRECLEYTGETLEQFYNP